MGPKVELDSTDYRAMSALVDLPGVANPLEDDWWLLEECASGLVMGSALARCPNRRSRLFAITEVTGG